jgi:hypothetical protein
MPARCGSTRWRPWRVSTGRTAIVLECRPWPFEHGRSSSWVSSSAGLRSRTPGTRRLAPYDLSSSRRISIWKTPASSTWTCSSARSAVVVPGVWSCRTSRWTSAFISDDPKQLLATAGLKSNATPSLELTVIGLWGFLAGSDGYGVLVGISPKFHFMSVESPR